MSVANKVLAVLDSRFWLPQASLQQVDQTLKGTHQCTLLTTSPAVARGVLHPAVLRCRSSVALQGSKALQGYHRSLPLAIPTDVWKLSSVC